MEYRSNIANLENRRLDLYKVTRAPGDNLQKHVGDVISVKEWCFFKDGDSEGRQREILAIVSMENKIYRTISPTFRRSFDDIVSNFFERPVISVIAGTSKSGRDFIDCVLIGEVEEEGV